MIRLFPLKNQFFSASQTVPTHVNLFLIALKESQLVLNTQNIDVREPEWQFAGYSSHLNFYLCYRSTRNPHGYIKLKSLSFVRKINMKK